MNKITSNEAKAAAAAYPEPADVEVLEVRPQEAPIVRC